VEAGLVKNVTMEAARLGWNLHQDISIAIKVSAHALTGFAQGSIRCICGRILVGE
jgi:hypothetical protein